MRIIYSIVILLGITLGFISLLMIPKSPFVPFNWYGLVIFISAGIFFVFSLKFQKIGPYILFFIGIFAMINTYFYFRQCSQIKGMELFGGFFISLAPIFTSKKTKKA
ncbi:hypothetical protein [Athalassotoga saccharophila]|uniref:hypothetical protein n=1 Tax=Athalassotoga saccharophila TaxID=1441386 RepID=UPI001379949B|nr:hypothetical protein [Athalassotoga saccharophila]BBJ28074.1 hypothetical protein ATHSA_0976 [Athalassotoga saccharophila]